MTAASMRSSPTKPLNDTFLASEVPMANCNTSPRSKKGKGKKKKKKSSLNVSQSAVPQSRPNLTDEEYLNKF